MGDLRNVLVLYYQQIEHEMIRDWITTMLCDRWVGKSSNADHIKWRSINIKIEIIFKVRFKVHTIHPLVYL